MNIEPASWKQETDNSWSCDVGDFSLEVWLISERVVCVSNDFDGNDRSTDPSEIQHWIEQRWAVSVFDKDTVIYNGNDPMTVLACSLEQAKHLALAIAGITEP